MTKRKAAAAAKKAATTSASTRARKRSNNDEKDRMRAEFDSLHKEVQIAEYARSHGQNRKKVPRLESVLRTKRRKLLEKEDEEALAIRAPSEDHDKIENQDAKSNKSRRLRGSKAAIEDHVIEASMIFPLQQKQQAKRKEQQQQQAIEEDGGQLISKVHATEGKATTPGMKPPQGEGDEEYDTGDEKKPALHYNEEEYIPNSDDGDDDDDDDGDGDGEEDGDDDEENDHQNDQAMEPEVIPAAASIQDKTPKSTASSKRRTKAATRTKKERHMYKMRGFQSQKMAQRHGDALGAHARGKPREAIEKLTQVAKDAPSAPQVYSSLGMVYEDMLQESRRRQRQDGSTSSKQTAGGECMASLGSTDATQNAENDKETEHIKLEDLDANLAQQLMLAEKAYGSYHVAAILCKKDFTLWVRAADSASDIADLHGNIMAIPNISIRYRKHYGSERRRWLSEALRDYIVADNLKPPGIDIPAKLAAMHMELGNLSEALTILTDLKNRSNSASVGKSIGLRKDDTGDSGSRSEFESSYKAWLLYADLMLRIGHECTQWNRGIQTNDNYMFRRWLRKLSRVFDWQERRLQALSLALESAAGSKSAEQFMSWMRHRALAKVKTGERSEQNGGEEPMEQQSTERWHLDTSNDSTKEQLSHAIIGFAKSSYLNATTAASGHATSRDASQEETKRIGLTEVPVTSRKKVSFQPGRVVDKTNGLKLGTSKLVAQELDIDGMEDEESKKRAAEVTVAYTGEKESDERKGTSLTNVEVGDGEGASPSPGTGEHSHHSISDGKELNPQFEREKKLLLEKNSAELEAFDKTTRDMNLVPESIEGKDRRASRMALLQRQEAAIATLVGEYQDQNANSARTTRETNILEANDSNDGVIGIYQEPLLISASCRTVCMIASELLKHLYGLKLYEGGRLVGEAVSLYLKERAAWQDKRTAARKEKDEWHRNAENYLFFAAEPYTEGPDISDEGEADVYLSDEEDLEGKDDLIENLRKGLLPPELRVLFALSLIVEGGRDFVAAKCLEAIDDLPQESRTWLSEGSIETNFADDTVWSLFRRAMTEPLGRTSAYAFVAEILQKSGKEEKWAGFVYPYFRRHLDTLKTVGLMDELPRMRGELTPFHNFRKNQIVKAILGAGRLELYKLESAETDSNHQVDEKDSGSRLALASISSLTNVLHLVWKVEANGALPPVCSEVVKVFGRSLAWVTRDGGNKLDESSRWETVSNVRRVVSFLSGAALPEFDGTEKVDCMSKLQWNGFPVQSSWQSDEFKSISLRVYNLCVACNVSLFSGWEPDEFSLRLLRRRHGDIHFGVNIDDGRVAGHLSNKLEGEICRQWDELSAILPWFSRIEFGRRLAEVKEKDWYKKEIQDKAQLKSCEPISKYSEEDGIQVFLAFSGTCLRLAASCTNEQISNQLLQASMSVLLPITQFGLDFAVWDSEIGEAASTLSDIEDWRIMAGANGDKKPVDKLPRQRKTQTAIEKKVQEWIKGTDKPTLQSFVRISTREMQARWQEAIVGAHEESTTEQSVDVMQKVHEASQQLRACYTDMAIEKACLQLSVALLDLASEPSCHNPFLCLQQAAMFASQGCKAGNSDLVFRNSIPEEKACSPLEALVILGRADCLQSVYFPNEAAFLCSYIGRVCSLHRDREVPELEWNARWKIVAIYAYNVSVMIRATVSTVLDKEMQKSFLSMWERGVVEELERGRIDAVAWKRLLSSGPTSDDCHPGGGGSKHRAIDEDKDEIDKDADDDASSTDDEEDGDTGDFEQTKRSDHSACSDQHDDDDEAASIESSDAEQSAESASDRKKSELPAMTPSENDNIFVNDAFIDGVSASGAPGEEHINSDDSMNGIVIVGV